MQIEYEYYLVLHSHVHDMYWISSTKEWTDNKDHATYFYWEWDVKAELTIVCDQYNPNGNHISIQKNALN